MPQIKTVKDGKTAFYCDDIFSSMSPPPSFVISQQSRRLSTFVKKIRGKFDKAYICFCEISAYFQ
jgi:hypothetical protein